MTFFAMLPFPPLVLPLSTRTFVHALVDRLHLFHEHHAHVRGHAIRQGLVLLEELDNSASKRCALFVLVGRIFVFCAFTELAALLIAPRTSTGAVKADMEGAVTVTPSMSPVSCT